jgi:hypothetical protein
VNTVRNIVNPSIKSIKKLIPLTGELQTLYQDGQTDPISILGTGPVFSK